MQAKNPSFRQKNGLTRYAFTCGYIQRVEVKRGSTETRVDLWHEGACFHVRAHVFNGAGRLFWESFHSITEAREFWHGEVWRIFRAELCEVAPDQRYSYRQEFHGERDPSHVVRFCGEWVGKSETVVGAMLLAWQHKQSRNGEGA
ncbi:TPA: hypothetical protein NH971_000923 [Pseudomonas aeruginosa]|uniref:hypothetical protein n=1 Tax=Pseudomonas aeruginosa TaxID=287 RepID=UPI0012FE0233|nr:hypothetical protein [Pseudomonas aeruginosa]HBO9091777.1 hypothetical protein [Pseudomonas aeruginosa]HCF0548424.1 hypothetical protein [Pseudomonas aeruginosa]HCF0562222.1 hypothetical protein [Pseudomonas aeruginosa]